MKKRKFIVSKGTVSNSLPQGRSNRLPKTVLTKPRSSIFGELQRRMHTLLSAARVPFCFFGPLFEPLL